MPDGEHSIDHLRILLAAATPGPVTAEIRVVDDLHLGPTESATLTFGDGSMCASTPRHAADFELAAAAINALPTLLNIDRFLTVAIEADQRNLEAMHRVFTDVADHGALVAVENLADYLNGQDVVTLESIDAFTRARQRLAVIAASEPLTVDQMATHIARDVDVLDEPPADQKERDDAWAYVVLTRQPDGNWQDDWDGEVHDADTIWLEYAAAAETCGVANVRVCKLVPVPPR